MFHSHFKQTDLIIERTLFQFTLKKHIQMLFLRFCWKIVLCEKSNRSMFNIFLAKIWFSTLNYL